MVERSVSERNVPPRAMTIPGWMSPSAPRSISLDVERARDRGLERVVPAAHDAMRREDAQARIFQSAEERERVSLGRVRTDVAALGEVVQTPSRNGGARRRCTRAGR